MSVAVTTALLLTSSFVSAMEMSATGTDTMMKKDGAMMDKGSMMQKDDAMMKKEMMKDTKTQ